MGFGLEPSGRTAQHPTEDVLRVYDSAGRLLFSALPANEFATFAAASKSERSFRHPATVSDLAPGPDRVGLYSASAGEYLELSLEGRVLGRWKTAHPDGYHGYIGLALVDRQSVYVQAGASEKAAPAMLKLDRTARTWQAPGGSWPAALIYGADRGRLVVSQRQSEVLWVRAQ